MNLVWKLLKSHISIPQFAGFFFANLCGMIIVLLGIQFYYDVMPVFTQEDSFMKANYIMVSKRIGTAMTLSGQSTTFSAEDTTDLSRQSFVDKLCAFTSTNYKVDAHMGVNGQQVLSSELYFESVPDAFVDIDKEQWHWKEGEKEVPIILPRTYINMYNFGFAQSHQLPKISDGLMGMIDFHIIIRGHGAEDEYKGRVVAFSSALSSILVPQSFMDWSNAEYAPDEHPGPTRLLMQVSNPADEHVSKYLEDKNLEIETDKLDQEKTTYFLRLVVSLVMVVGIVISILSFYILMLSIYLLVQKNSSKLENLLLIGYSPAKVALPYQLLTMILNVCVLVIALIAVFAVRSYYLDVIVTLFPDIDEATMLPALSTGMLLFVGVTMMNVFIIRRKIMRIWFRKD